MTDVPSHIPHVWSRVANGEESIDNLLLLQSQISRAARQVLQMGVRSMKSREAVLETVAVEHPKRKVAFMEGLMDAEAEALQTDAATTLRLLLFLAALSDTLCAAPGLLVILMDKSGRDKGTRRKAETLLRARRAWSQSIHDALKTLCMNKGDFSVLPLPQSSYVGHVGGRSSQHFWLARADSVGSSAFMASLTPALVDFVSESLLPDFRTEWLSLIKGARDARGEAIHHSSDAHAKLFVEPSADVEMLTLLSHAPALMDEFRVHAPTYGATALAMAHSVVSTPTFGDGSAPSHGLWSTLQSLPAVERAFVCETIQPWQLADLLLTGDTNQLLMLRRSLDLPPPNGTVRPAVAGLLSSLADHVLNTTIPDDRSGVFREFLQYVDPDTLGQSIVEHLEDMTIPEDNLVMRALTAQLPTQDGVVAAWSGFGSAQLDALFAGNEVRLLAYIRQLPLPVQ